MIKHYINLLRLWMHSPLSYRIDDAWIRAIDCAEDNIRLTYGTLGGNKLIQELNTEVGAEPDE